jgi:hypothetical protein
VSESFRYDILHELPEFAIVNRPFLLHLRHQLTDLVEEQPQLAQVLVLQNSRKLGRKKSYINVPGAAFLATGLSQVVSPVVEL